MCLNHLGCIVADEIQKTPIIRHHVTLDRWIVMPNHVHMIWQIEEKEDDPVETSRRDVSTSVAECIPLSRRIPDSLGSIIQSIKCICTKRIRNMGYIDFAWQSNYHDRIITNDKMLYSMRNYILMNPSSWEHDRNHPNNSLHHS